MLCVWCMQDVEALLNMHFHKPSFKAAMAAATAAEASARRLPAGAPNEGAELSGNGTSLGLCMLLALAFAALLMASPCCVRSVLTTAVPHPNQGHGRPMTLSWRSKHGWRVCSPTRGCPCTPARLLLSVAAASCSWTLRPATTRRYLQVSPPLWPEDGLQTL